MLCSLFSSRAGLGLRGAGGDQIDGNDIETNWDESVDTFDALELKEPLLRGIYAYGFEKPSAIQQRAIMPMIEGRDMIAQSQSGTGKTAVFCIGVLQTLDLTTTDTQALILSPTRELAEQHQKVMLALGDYLNVQCHACIGGKSIGEDIRRLDYGVQAVSGTPGRVFDMIGRRNLRTRSIKVRRQPPSSSHPPSSSSLNMRGTCDRTWDRTYHHPTSNPLCTTLHHSTSLYNTLPPLYPPSTPCAPALAPTLPHHLLTLRPPAPTPTLDPTLTPSFNSNL